MKHFLEAARHGRHGVRDYLMMLMAYRLSKITTFA
jgi:hypothetical protein